MLLPPRGLRAPGASLGAATSPGRRAARAEGRPQAAGLAAEGTASRSSAGRPPVGKRGAVCVARSVSEGRYWGKATLFPLLLVV